MMPIDPKVNHSEPTSTKSFDRSNRVKHGTKSSQCQYELYISHRFASNSSMIFSQGPASWNAMECNGRAVGSSDQGGVKGTT